MGMISFPKIDHDSRRENMAGKSCHRWIPGKRKTPLGIVHCHVSNLITGGYYVCIYIYISNCITNKWIYSGFLSFLIITHGVYYWLKLFISPWNPTRNPTQPPFLMLKPPWNHRGNRMKSPAWPPCVPPKAVLAPDGGSVPPSTCHP